LNFLDGVAHRKWPWHVIVAVLRIQGMPWNVNGAVLYCVLHFEFSGWRGTQEMAMARDRLLNGLAKLQETNIVVDRMQRELSELQPILAEKTKDTQRLLTQVRSNNKN